MSDVPLGPDWFQAADGKWYPPAPPGGYPAPAAASSRRWITAVAAFAVTFAVGIAVLALVLQLQNNRRDAEVAATTATTAAPTLTQKTDAAGTKLSSILCAGKPQGTGKCFVDWSKPGVVEINIPELLVDTDALGRAGNETGFWDNADTARMGRTRALDGTQKSSDGRVTWTFHPDDGLTLVIEIK